MFGDDVNDDTAVTDLSGLLDRLDSCLEMATKHDVRAESDIAIAKALERLPRLTARLDAVKAAVTDQFDIRDLAADDNVKSTRAWLRNRCRMAPEDAARQARHARHLRNLPATAAALAAGEISSAVVQRIIGADNPRTRDALHRDEPKIVRWAREERFEIFCQRLARWQEDNDPDGAFRDRAEGRRFHCSRSFQGGHALDGWLDPINGTIFTAEHERREKELFDADWAEAQKRLGRIPTITDLRRTATQRRADALVLMAERSAAMPAGARMPRPLITIVAGPVGFARMCETYQGDQLSPAEAARLLDRSLIETMVFPDDMRTVDMSTQRTFTGALRRAIKIRDRECTRELCDEPGHRCQVDHDIEWSKGGPTTIANGRLLCGFHNRARNSRPPPDD